VAQEANLMGMVRILKPYWHFEYWYDRTTAPALPGSTPIPFMPVNPTIPAFGAPPVEDPYAFDEAARTATPGYSPHLAAMLPVPAIGTDILVWIPKIPSNDDAVNHAYLFVPVWRIRTVRDTNSFRKPGNMPREGFGAQETVGMGLEDRYILPAAINHGLVVQPEPGLPGTYPGRLGAELTIAQGIAMCNRQTDLLTEPVGPDGAALYYQQGILNPASVDGITNPMFRHYWLKTLGNEFAVWCFKIASPQPDDEDLTYVDWDFRYNPATGYCDNAAADLFFSTIFGVGSDPVDGFVGRHPNSGIYVMGGTT
jgi:hypothetical protein